MPTASSEACPPQPDQHPSRLLPHRLTRRGFFQNATLASAGIALLPQVQGRVRGANEKLNLAAIGAGGKGAVDIGFCAGENIVALADVDESRASSSYRRFPNAKRYRDFRVMLEKQKDIDAVTVSTPDHTHAIAAVMAMQLGKHVYCQKPLTHSIHEARVLKQVAAETKVITQMGNQGHCHNDSRRLVELIWSGVLGEVREAHVWTDRPIWPQGIARPTATPPVPKNLDWDLWLGPAKQRPYHSAYLPFKWRGWYDFGTGAQGDMGCHNMDLAFWALMLRDPHTIEAAASDKMPETFPKASTIKYHFAPRRIDGRDHPACTLTWYDGGRKPDPTLAGLNADAKLPKNGSIIIGSKDTLYVPHYWGDGRFISGKKTADFNDIPQTLPRNPGKNNDQDHHIEWINACKGVGKAYSDFNYAGPMTEVMLLGNVALRAGKTIKWDAKAMRVTNDANANSFVRDEYRQGWKLGATLKTTQT